jgi:uncharacterized protein YicC (UPF0701 family)
LRQLLTKNLKRGKVDCTVHLRSAQAAERELRIDEAALARVAAAVNQVARTVPGSTIDAVEVLRWPGVIETATQDSDALLGAGRTVFQQTLDELGAMRLREGKRLGDLIEQRCAGLAQLVAQVRARLPEIQTRVRPRLHERGAGGHAPISFASASIRAAIVCSSNRTSATTCLLTRAALSRGRQAHGFPHAHGHRPGVVQDLIFVQ